MKNTSSLQSTDLLLRAVQSARAKFIHREYPNQIKQSNRETPKILCPSLFTVVLDEWMAVALGKMKILRCRTSSALHSHSHQKPIPESMLNVEVIFLYPLSCNVDPTMQIYNDSNGGVLYIPCIRTASGLFFNSVSHTRGSLIMAFHYTCKEREKTKFEQFLLQAWVW